MKLSSRIQMQATAFLYDHLNDFPVWIRKLTRGQLENIARIMAAWHAAIGECPAIMTMEEVEKREVIRAITLSGGDVVKAAEALKLGKTTSRVENRRSGFSLPVAVGLGFRFVASIRFGLTLFPVPAHRTGQADFPHPALGKDSRLMGK